MITENPSFEARISGNFHAPLAEARDGLLRGSLMENQDERESLMRDNIEQRDVALGLYGVWIIGTEVSVLSTIETYLNPDFRSVTNVTNSTQPTPVDFFESTAQKLSISRDAVRGSMEYYHKYQTEIDAYFTYQNALARTASVVQDDQISQ